MGVPVDMAYGDASSYSNAKEFYNSTGKEDSKHIDVSNGVVYFATQAKLATSSSNLRYVTLGFDVKLTGNGKSVSFAVKRGDSLAEVANSSVESDGYQYLLFCISTEDLISLLKATGNADVDTVLSAAEIEVRMDAIMTTTQNGTDNGSIEENDFGGITEKDTVYHVNNADDLKTLKDTFSGHPFESYTDIRDYLDNYQLSILYSVGDGASVGNGYSKKTYTSGSTTVSNAIFNGSDVVMDKHRVMQEFYLKTTESFGLSKTGYHMVSGKEWKKADGTIFNGTTLYTPKNLDTGIGYANKGVILYANWKPNIYTVQYDINGGIGYVSNSVHTYDFPSKLRSAPCVKEGYSLVPGAEWNTKPDGSGTSYGAGDYVMNLTAEDGGKVTLYANWKEAVYEVETNKDGGSGGTDTFFEQYTIGWFSDAGIKNAISNIQIPQKAGYWFEGYYTYFLGMGDPITDKWGTLLQSPDFFTRNSKVYANWEPKTYSIFFDKQGGSGGWDSVTATYDKMVSFAGNSPIKDGYSFMGYFDGLNGVGNRYYNEHMSGEQYYRKDGDLTLFAYWLDETPPILTLEAPIVWSNASGGIKITATAMDVGTGLSKVELYCDSNTTPVKTKTINENNVQKFSFDYYNTAEGVHQYRVVAYDKAGNKSEAYVTVRYDITAPTGTYTVTNWDYANFGVTITATDYKIP